MKILFIVLVHHILDSHASLTLPAPVNATLVSNNFQHSLRWSPGGDTPPQTTYRIKRWKNGHEKILEFRHRNHSVDISRHMKDIYARYSFQIWASIGNKSSFVANVTPSNFFPIEKTTIGPPSVYVLGCGDCLTLTIVLAKGDGIKHNDSIQFYRTIQFFISWKKTRDEMVDSRTYWDPPSHENATSVTYVYKLKNLQQQEEYCVKVLPNTNVNPNTLSSDWVFAFTSTSQPREVTYLLSWSLGSVLVGVCVLLIVASLKYTGFLCKLSITLPKVLRYLQTGLFHGYIYVSLEEIFLSVAEFDCITRMNTRQYLLQTVQDDQTEQHDDYGGSGGGDAEDDDEDSNMDSHYIERVANDKDSCTTNNAQSSAITMTFLCESVHNSGGCTSEDGSAEAEEPTLCLLQLNVVRGEEHVPLPDSVELKPNPPKSKDLEKEREQMKEEAGGGGLRNISLLSVTLKSMQLKEQAMREVTEPLLRDQQEQTLSQPQTGRSLLTVLHTPASHQANSKMDRLMGQTEDVPEVRHDRCDQSHDAVSMVPEHEGSSEEDEDDCSGYMTR